MTTSRQAIAHPSASLRAKSLNVLKALTVAPDTLLRNCQGYVVISGYACPLYTELYERHGWQRHDKEAQTNSGGKRVESVWLSPRTAEALSRPQQQGLFAL